MVIVKLLEGLGNQMFQYAVGRKVALEKKVDLKLDLSFYVNGNSNTYKLNQFNIHAEVATVEEISDMLGKRNHSFSAKALNKIKNTISGYPVLWEKEWWVFDDKFDKLSKSVYLHGFWQHLKYLDNLNPLILEELTLKNDDTLVNLSKIFSACQSVSVHIRRGDYLTNKEANTLIGTLPVKYYQDAMNIIESKISDPQYFFFSDDIAWVKNEFKHLQNAFFIEGYKNYEDLILMSRCRHNIIANSSFSWWAAFLNNNTSKLVVSPKQWVLPDEVNKKIHLVPPEWVRV
jgi:Glycosyl transferase family 11